MKRTMALMILLLSVANLFAIQTSKRVTFVLNYSVNKSEAEYFQSVTNNFITNASWALGDVKSVYPSATALADSIRLANGKYQEAVFVILTHGVGYNQNLLTSFGELEIHNDFNKEIDVIENSLKQAGTLINVWGKTSKQPVGLGIKVTEYKVDAYWTEILPGPCFNFVTRLEIHGSEFVAGRMLGAGKFSLLREKYFLSADINKDGKITLESYLTNPEKKLFNIKGGESAFYEEPFDQEEIGFIDIDNDNKVDDFLFVYNGRLAIDVDCQNPNDPVIDGLDEDNDGVFTAIDFNSDGDVSDFVWYKEGIVLAEGILWEENFNQIISSFQGKKVVLIGACYGAGMIDKNLPPLTAGYAFASEMSEAPGGEYFLKFGEKISNFDRESYWLGIFNQFSFGFINDNGDGISPLPILGGNSGEDGYFSSMVRMKAEEYSAVFTIAFSPGKFYLAQNYPNPFNPTTTIQYELGSPTHVHLTIFNSLGQEVEKVVDEFQSPGSHQVVWNAGDAPSGVYYYHLSGKGISEVRRMTLLR